LSKPTSPRVEPIVNHLLCGGSKARWCPSYPLIALSKSAWSLSHLLYNTNKVYWIEKGGGKTYLKICAELTATTVVSVQLSDDSNGSTVPFLEWCTLNHYFQS
jgi:hypothetical protein